LTFFKELGAMVEISKESWRLWLKFARGKDVESVSPLSDLPSRAYPSLALKDQQKEKGANPWQLSVATQHCF